MHQLRHEPQFNYHLTGENLGVLHICFADNLLMCCRADIDYIYLLVNTFQHFFEMPGLQVNMDKISLYIVGVSNMINCQMINDLHVKQGELPFKYLGVPFSTRKLSAHQCLPMVEKMIDSVKCWSSKFLSYSGRLKHIKIVLLAMQTYWEYCFCCQRMLEIN